MRAAADARAVSEGGLLGGKLRYRQFATGHRTGFEPVLLAASLMARPGERVLEAGCGAGAALLCLGARVAGLQGVGVEIDPETAELANENFKINGFYNFSCICSSIETLTPDGEFAHVMANPPWFARGNTQSPDRLRALAHHGAPELLGNWITALSAWLAPHGSLTLILPGQTVAGASAALRARGFGGVKLLPLWPRAGRPAKIVIISARLHAREPDRLLPGLILHDQNGITKAAQDVLRNGQPIVPG